MEDFLNFKESASNHWKASYDGIVFDIEKDKAGYHLNVDGGDVHQTIDCKTLEEAKERAKKFLVW